MRIDLHTHSRVSDGTDRPSDLVRAAAAAGLDVLGLTDHDTADGWPEAAAEAERLGLVIVPGIEVSTRTGGSSVHLLAYWPDPRDEPLARELAAIRADRDARLERIVARLVEHGLELTVEEVRAGSPDASSVGRPHVADALVARGYVRDRSQAFARWLAEGRPGALRKHAPETAEAIRLVRAAGGVSVLAHPWGRGGHRVLDEERIAALADAGLAGLEVDHYDHSEADRAGLRGVARELDLVVTGSSDHHGVGKTDHPLGLFTTDPEMLERLREQAG